MPDFAYVARDMAGKSTSGTIAAANAREAATQLGARSLFPISITVNKTSQVKMTRRVPGAQMGSFYAQCASLLRAGVPMLRALTLLSNQSGGNKTLQNAVGEIRGRVEEGGVARRSHGSRYPRIFNEMAINMVRAGSEGGFLEDALERVGGFVEKQEEMKGKTMGAIAYPVFVMFVGVIVVSILLIFFVPQFNEILAPRCERAANCRKATELLCWP